MRWSDLVEVVHHVWIEAGLAVRQILTRSLVREATRCVEQPFATTSGVEVLLGDFPDFVLQHGETIFGEINELAMERFGLGVPGCQPALKLFVGFRHLTFGRRLAALVLGGEFRVASFVLFLRFAFALLEPALEQHVVDHANDRIAKFTQVVAVQRDLRIGPQLVEIARIDR